MSTPNQLASGREQSDTSGSKRKRLSSEIVVEPRMDSPSVFDDTVSRPKRKKRKSLQTHLLPSTTTPTSSQALAVPVVVDTSESPRDSVEPSTETITPRQKHKKARKEAKGPLDAHEATLPPTLLVEDPFYQSRTFEPTPSKPPAPTVGGVLLVFYRLLN